MDGEEASERSLVERLARGEPKAWNQAFASHRDKVYGFCLRMMRNREEAEDVSQEVFLRAVRAIGTFRGDASIGTWLHQIARNLCLTRLQATKRDRDNSAELAWISAVMGDNASADTSLTSGDLRKGLEIALGALEPMFREVLLLREVQDLSYEEIAKVTGVAVNTVKTRIFRARAKLQQQLAEFR